MGAVLMFKTLVLGALYNLSDGQIEYQVRDRLSFLRILGLGLADRVPDAKTVWLWCEALGAKLAKWRRCPRSSMGIWHGGAILRGAGSGPVTVWCRSFHSILCIKGDALWDQHGRTNFARMRCGSH